MKSYRAPITALLTMLVLWGCNTSEKEAPTTTGPKATPVRVALICGDQDNGEAFAALLRDSGMDCQLLAQSELPTDWQPEDLLVFLSCYSRANGSGASRESALIDALGTARVLACGDPGAALLKTKQLLIGHPHGWLGTKLPKVIVVPHQVATGPLGQILRKPKKLTEQTEGDVSIRIHEGEGELEHIGIYDGGSFPAGTTGIGRESTDMHHWMICKQGNYTLWGANSRADALTDEGKDLFVNLCWFLAETSPEELVFPEKVYVSSGSHEGVLEGGGRDKYYLKVMQRGSLRLTLEWDQPNTMMFITHRPLRKRVDGNSPLEIKHQINEDKDGADFEIAITSFGLPEGEKCPYLLTIQWE